MKRRVLGGSVEANGLPAIVATETKLFGSLPHLVDHCSCVKYDDGEPRRPGWFTVKSQGSAWVVQVKDPDACAQLSAVAQTLDDALVLADLLLGSESAPWEPDQFLRAQGAKKKKG